jgi:hypothetical protein
MGSSWINNSFNEFSNFIMKVENKVKTSLELKSQFSELEYKIVQETKKQVFNKRNNNCNKRNKNNTNLSLSSIQDFSNEILGEENTADQTKEHNCDQSIIVKDSQFNKFSALENSKFFGSSDDIKSLNKIKETEVHFTCYNEFSNKDQIQSINNSNKHKKSIKDSIEKTNEKFLISLKETKFETLNNIAYV